MRARALALLAGAFLASKVHAADADRAPTIPVEPSIELDVERSESLIMDLVYTAEAVSTVAGGKERGIRYLDNLGLVVSADLDALIGWRGARMRLQGLYNNGASISDLIGDSQGASNIETGVRAARLFEAWIEQRVGDAASLRVGLYDLNSEFDNISIAENFVGSAYGIGTDIAQTGLNGPSIFPTTSLGARLDYRPAMGWVLRAALLDGVPGDPHRPSRTIVRIGADDGFLFAGEVEVPLPKGKLLIGHWRYSGRFEMIDSTGMAKGNNGTYVRMETPVWAKANMLTCSPEM